MGRPRTGSATKQSRSGGVAVQQLDVDVLRTAQKGNPNPGPDRRRLPGELGALLLQLGDNVVNAADPQSDMLEPEIRRLRRSRDGLFRRHLSEKDRHAAEIEIETRPAIRLDRADDLSAEHFGVPAGRRLRIRAAQMDMVVGESGHVSLLLSIDEL